MTSKKRLDLLLVEQGLATSLAQARALIGAGQVLLAGQRCDKAGTSVATDSQLSLKSLHKNRSFVSRGGDKLDGALSALALDPKGLVCADIGCSTGGFTDCLLSRGAARIYAVDVGYGVLDWKLRQNAKVKVLERTNARYLSTAEIPEPLDLAVIDASFIALEPLLTPLPPLFQETIRIVALVKPQFQLPKDKVGAGGIVRDETLHQEALDAVAAAAHKLGLRCQAVVASALRGTKGNQEFFMDIVGTARKTGQETHLTK